ncbi:hypothetical protein HMPREF3158_05490 [Corynebacterium sp. HMSC06G04]|uniref:hypothetical protein n=1 Tax=Corynebacterium sp. HMSC06G04 TaxID=1581126 RepID=UPI0008A2FF81|nr:hypothetical protein [Corynebacterium sp. HMSC06G04]OFT46996.1 hypothetical protein HMPREF3158_05490 [Corynebacterium sp. HMSC06G04]
MTQRKTFSDHFKTIDFIPLPGAFWLEYLEKDGTTVRSEMPGLLKEEFLGINITYWGEDGKPLRAEFQEGTKDIEFHAADIVDGEVVRADIADNFLGCTPMRQDRI